MEPLQASNLLVVAEDFVETGRPASGYDSADRQLMASCLAELVELGSLYPAADSFPTDTLIHEFNQLWPKPHNVLFDFNRGTSLAGWLDEIANANRLVAKDCVTKCVIGHLDWSAKHCRVLNNRVSVVYDWDSTAYVPESRVLGESLRSFTYKEGVREGLTPNITEMVDFLWTYETSRNQEFSDQELNEIVSFLLYGAAYAARCEDSIDDASSSARRQNREFLKTLVASDLLKVFRNR